MNKDKRADRLHSVASEDQRQPFERDRDRILYSSAFHRLSGITQIVRSGEADVFHTRQQHSIKVAQVGRRLAQHCMTKYPKLAAKHGIDPEVVEAACLGHDLGHPPFGHVGEAELNKLVEGKGDSDGFEGNAQSFRVLTKLIVRFRPAPGLDLTRATLAACLKYPWFRDKNIEKKSSKWSAYQTEREDFEFAREFCKDEAQTPEAALMDWADDIAYSVHDLEDFHRCDAIPWNLILDQDNGEVLVERANEAWYGAPRNSKGKLRDALRHIREILSLYEAVISEPYEGSREQRRALRTLTSSLIGRYIKATKLSGGKKPILVSDELEVEVKILKQITRDYIISNPSLAAQQFGQRKVIKNIFDAIICNSDETYPNFLPKRLRYLWDLSDNSTARFAADCISSLTENEIVGLHGRLFGTASGSVLDPIVR